MEQGEAYYATERISWIFLHSDSETKGPILYLMRQVARVEALGAWNRVLEARVQELEARLAQNSRNSSKPLSSDWGAIPSPSPRTRSLRERSGKKPGGQVGHEGFILEMSANPDHLVRHRVTLCRSCGHGLRAAAPDALATYFLHGQLLPMERTAESFSEAFGQGVSEGFLASLTLRTSEKLEKMEAAIRDVLLHSDVAFFDESGMRCEKKGYWLHEAGTEALTVNGISEKRSREAMEGMGILPRYQGVAVHDHWSSYFHYGEAAHALCNAHHLRELTFTAEVLKESWAAWMKDLLKAIHCKVEGAKAKGKACLSPYLIGKYETEYCRVLLFASCATLVCPSPTRPSGTSAWASSN